MIFDSRVIPVFILQWPIFFNSSIVVAKITARKYNPQTLWYLSMPSFCVAVILVRSIVLSYILYILYTLLYLSSLLTKNFSDLDPVLIVVFVLVTLLLISIFVLIMCWKFKSKSKSTRWIQGERNKKWNVERDR